MAYVKLSDSAYRDLVQKLDELSTVQMDDALQDLVRRTMSRKEKYGRSLGIRAVELDRINVLHREYVERHQFVAMVDGIIGKLKASAGSGGACQLSDSDCVALLGFLKAAGLIT